LTGTTLQTRTLEQDSAATISLQNVVWSLDGKQLVALVSVTAVGSVVEIVHVQVWDAATGQRVRSFAATQPETPQASGQIHSTIYLSALNEQYLAVAKLTEINGKTSFSQVQVIEIWDVATGQMIATLGGEDRSPDPTVQQMLWAPDHRRLATIRYEDAGGGAVWQIWDALTGQKIHSLSIPFVQQVIWLPDGKSVALGLDVYDVETGNIITTYNLDQYGGTPDAVAWSPDGKRIAGSSFRTGHFSPFFGTLLAASSDTYGSNILFILNTSDGRQTAKYDEGETKPENLVWSPDGKSLLILRSDIEVWRIE
jgi:WD40 repeat protein